jgi:hypothetical protein
MVCCPFDEGALKIATNQQRFGVFGIPDDFRLVAMLSSVRRDGLNPESGGRRAEDQTTGRP